MTIATSDEQRAVQDAIRSWAASVAPIAALRAGDGTAWINHWDGLAQLGVFAVAVGPEHGGVDGTVVDLAAMLEQAARELVSGPVLSTALAGLLLKTAAQPSAKAVGADIADGRLQCAVALGDSAVTARPGEDRALVLNGSAGLAMGSAPGVAVLLAADTGTETVWCLVESDAEGLIREAAAGLDVSVPVERVHCANVVVPADRILTGLDHRSALDRAATLAAAEAAGVAGWCLDTAVAYAKIREQFGRKIGSFQAVKHICAQMLCRAEAARVVAWDAAVAAERGDELPFAAAVAAAVALDAAVENAKDCIQVLGGIGFTWEHDAHFYLRRAAALRQLLGGSSSWRRRVAELAKEGRRRSAGIDLSDHDELRQRIRAEVDAVSALPAERRRAALVERGLFAPHWPKPFGRDADAVEQLLIDEELRAAGVERADLVVGWWAIPTILEHGTPEQIERHVLATLRGDTFWCQLFSEPGAGSDLASLRTTATKVSGGWRLQGQKVWTSAADRANWAICLARTNREAPKHRGITYFLVDMSSPGITVAPLREITGEPRFNEVFLDDVFVPDDCVVGPVDGGWRLANTTLANERVAIGGGSTLGQFVEQLIANVDVRDAVTADRLGGLIAQVMVGTLLDVRTTIRQLAGQDPGPASSVRKLVGVQYRQDIAEFAMEVSGAEGALDTEASHEFLLTRCLSIAGGTTQILLTVAAERILGLPREGKSS
ncbi:acyl-CoA dehydrogenase [Skermania sp. ID1734]|uniref:acyl-CoA dehydrogenase n=1 Tax=Skermania sp. ID1734 TaxID=2597516 RepID=UPI00117DC9BD|nr:acyl-CoA dehydrogenase [Skermania sp. ID1734]TSD95637.1 acyl-CoA dehydrogenase [Skermania sp. ID1734]